MKKILFAFILFAFPPSVYAMEKCTKCYCDSKEYGIQKKSNHTAEELQNIVMDSTVLQYDFDEEKCTHEYPQGFNKGITSALRKKLVALNRTSNMEKTNLGRELEETEVGHSKEKEHE